MRTPTGKLAAPGVPQAQPVVAPQEKKDEKKKKKGMWAKKLRVLVNKMVGSSHTLIAIRMVRSKLRKREETNNNSLGHGPNRVVHPHTALTPLGPAHPQLQSSTDGSKVSYAQR